jgi:hypothetical protein
MQGAEGDISFSTRSRQLYCLDEHFERLVIPEPELLLTSLPASRHVLVLVDGSVQFAQRVPQFPFLLRGLCSAPAARHAR